MNIVLPSIWLIILLAGLPQLSESVYTPSLPDIALHFGVSPSIIEYTLSIYLAGFAVGTLVWGKFSDKYGRKPGIMLGLIIFMAGTAGCYFSESVTALMLSRFVQAFGGSIGSVLTQAVCRDAFHGPALGKVYALIGGSLAIFPAIGPFTGGVIAENLGWRNIFLVLLLFAGILLVLSQRRLPETHTPVKGNIAILKLIRDMLTNSKVLGCGLLVAGCNGIAFSYYAEGPFFLVKTLGLSPSVFGSSFLAIASGTLLGGLISRYLHGFRSTLQIMQYGLIIILMGTLIFSFCIIANSWFAIFSNMMLIMITITFMMIIMFGICMVTGNALAFALVDYKWCTGTASSLFGFFYYCLIALLTVGIGYLHNGSLLVMPLYFLAISICMIFIKKFTLSEQAH